MCEKVAWERLNAKDSKNVLTSLMNTSSCSGKFSGSRLYSSTYERLTQMQWCLLSHLPSSHMLMQHGGIYEVGGPFTGLVRDFSGKRSATFSQNKKRVWVRCCWRWKAEKGC